MIMSLSGDGSYAASGRHIIFNHPLLHLAGTAFAQFGGNVVAEMNRLMAVDLVDMIHLLTKINSSESNCRIRQLNELLVLYFPCPV